MIDSGIPPDDFVDEINQHISENGYHGHGDSMICYPIPALPVAVKLKIWFVANLSADERSEKLENIENMVRCAFRQNTDYQNVVTQTWAQSLFSFSRLTEELHQNFAGIKTLEFDNTDIRTELELATLECLSLTTEVAAYV